MPHRFPTEAANADVLGEDPQEARQDGQAPPTAGSAAPPRERAQRSQGGERAAAESQARPGKDINQAGFLKDKDNDKDSGGQRP